ncbi:major facilitator superfamily transporter [Colletotrichum graminicola]|uniref:Major facilitator superfamily transporter n=1 Tax=Colletotrichum graminicola (strain M1.001 / M2 / FGSC 10212) TaxID=645133 RepID=E3QHP6_COLGM|nr:major facilitator superfamily transporter [Colletotrichum graminicola M1.001]EFQ30384.1 major facilitator superfamily transporter [Colletotrichum graminicola M1.001]WDK18636.1 major facilitator superfamily transporter [Colletotrichum graminicola]
MATSSDSKDTKRISSTSDVAAGTSNVYDGGPIEEIDDGYLRASGFTRFYRGVLFQMILFGALSFVGPAMSDAITNLGGGGLSTPYLANLATALAYSSGCLLTIFGGPLINKFGIKWSCMIAAVAMPLAGSAYYVSAKYHVDWYLLLARLVGGFANGFLYVAETAAMLSYPDANNRGFYLGIWSSMRNSGSVLGGAINFSNNSSRSSSGGVAWSTYLIFVSFECTGVIWAALLSPTRRVRRKNGDKIPQSGDISWKAEFVALWRHLQRKKTWLMSIPAFYSFFCGGTLGTYLSLHFSVRARALSSLLTPTLSIIIALAFGKLLDRTRWSQTKRAWIAFVLWAVPQAASFIWMGVEYSKFGRGKSKEGLDYELHSGRWAEAYLPYLIMFSTSYLCQMSLYWIMSTFSTDVGSSSRTGGLFRAFETGGQAVSYAINSTSGADPRIPFYINAALLVLSVPCMVFLIRLVPEAPASTDVDAGDLAAIDGGLDPDRK